jgi:hypothetical protein
MTGSVTYMALQSVAPCHVSIEGDGEEERSTEGNQATVLPDGHSSRENMAKAKTEPSTVPSSRWGPTIIVRDGRCNVVTIGDGAR